jgi:hypothetical protein
MAKPHEIQVHLCWTQSDGPEAFAQVLRLSLRNEGGQPRKDAARWAIRLLEGPRLPAEFRTQLVSEKQVADKPSEA